MERQGMLVSQRIANVFTAFAILHVSVASYCDLSSNYFQWLTENSSLLLPAPIAAAEESSWNEYGCNTHWEALPQYPSCTFCTTRNALVCHSSQPYRIPVASSLPTSNLSVYSLSGAGLVSLPPRSFSGLSIQKLIIQSSNITFLGHDTFAEVESVKFLFLRNNSFDILTQAGTLFHPLQNLKALSLADNELKILLSFQSAGLHKLEYFSLKGNAIHTLDLFFLQNSSLTFLDLRYVTFKDNFMDMEDTGLSSLPSTLGKVDLSCAKISVRVMKAMLKQLHRHNITMLNVGYLRASHRILSALSPIKSSLRFLSLEGTDLSIALTNEYTTDLTFDNCTFSNIIELNMKNCRIKYLGKDTMRLFPNVKVLSLAENLFTTLDLSAFFNLHSLNFMDLRSIYITDISSDSNSTVESLQVLDLASMEFYLYENTSQNIVSVFPNLQKLSLCNADVTPNLIWAIGRLDRLEYLDLSSTLLNSNSLLSAYNYLFSTINSSLIELYFARNNFKPTYNDDLCFCSLKSLKVLDLSNNLIRELSEDFLGSSVDTLILSQNLITTWYSPTIQTNSKIKFLDLSNNQITYVSDAMVHDFYKLEFLDLSENPLMCHNKVVAMVCADVKNETHNLTMLSSQEYKCYDILSNNYRLFSEPEECDAYYEEVSTTPKNQGNTNTPQTPEAMSPDKYAVSRQRNLNALITVGLVSLAAVSAIIGCIVYFKWWAIRCYIHRYFTLRRAHLLRKEGPLLGKPDINYDVFVSYSDVDRSWILDHLIPNMEADGDVTLCFHERDFQVGLSILENIIECMDRSHSILLIVSSAFVRSKWCQFEMHLAQYRLIETLRNQLVLVLLEDIPRKARPSVLHHLMMTKTYLLWPHSPCKDDAKELFWRRLKRALKPNYSHIFGV